MGDQWWLESAGWQEPIEFSAVMDTAAVTRTASYEIGSVAALQGRGFGVFASYTGLHKYSDSDVISDFMYDQKVEYTSGAWTYSPKLYWPNGEGEAAGATGLNPHYVSFFAYAPYSDAVATAPATNPAGYCIPEFNDAHAEGDPWLTYRLIDQPNLKIQTDLLFAKPLLDQSKPATGSRLSFSFRHALACVGDRVTIGLSDDMWQSLKTMVDHTVWEKVEVKLTSVKLTYNLTERAKMVLWNDGTTPNWQTELGEESLTERTVELTGKTISGTNFRLPYTLYTYDGATSNVKTAWTETDGGVFYIPIETEAQTATVDVGFDVIATKNGVAEPASKKGTASITLHDYPDGFQPGKHLYIGVTLDLVAITLKTTIVPWVTVDKGGVIAEQ